MPRTRPDVSRDQKLDQIVAIAERRLRDGGHEALSVAAIARELGIAQNAIYWYFPSKDHLFVAALERILRRTAARKPSKDVGTIRRILWFTDQFEALSELRAAMNNRARSAEVVADFVDRLDATLTLMLAGALREHVTADELDIAVETFRATVEGTFVKGLDRRTRRRVLTYALERVTAGTAD
jgi:AcrR family transcriptional regulator